MVAWKWGVNPNRHTLADELGKPVTYMGQDSDRNYLFSNGVAPMITHRFGTLEAAVQRFGKRIQTECPKTAWFKEGLASFKAGDIPARFIALPNDRREYVLGYLSGMLSAPESE